MAKKLMGLEVRGKHKKWGFAFYGDPKHLDEWRADGLEIGLIENVIPEWVVNAGLIRLWLFLQDVFNFRNPWRQ